ncbi:carboxymuconolactone decarboxylase family protein [Spiribacter aquaticus]|uniref:Carboxymuconolactone decarboxylase family protein n=1 Tax=Spiribacter aquaticus TaxID=1935996 RepID=A0A557RMN0_9GAMM|nr:MULTISPECIES: carboxymuconolactone decarboxylase family protein [Spiribacter]KAF0279483.1 carboxymuconolactone decarboxylase [Spiribacter roseus]TVO66439.1 carboxymuconolactone decarboxylase family protein [Spiribacter aquaticus]
MSDELPPAANRVARDHPEVWAAYSELGRAAAENGPLDERSRRLVKLALAIGTGSEGATHSHARRALAEGVDPEALRHVALLAIPTAGFPAAVAGLSWIEDILGPRE